jgi:hypothetical protein
MATAYRPYQSDESESESDSDTSLTSESEAEVNTAVPNFRNLAQNLSMNRLAGPPNVEEVFPLGYPITNGYPTFKNYEIPQDPSGTELKSSSKSVTSIIMLDSTDRDRGVFPQPTSLTLRLPRVYSNVTNFQLVQIKLLSAFFYFRPDKHNTDISILELGRTVPDDYGNIVPDIVTTYIRNGTYDINSLLAELNTELNITPVFYDFPNGFQDFAPRFAATGDFSIGFNFPGDTYYDSLLNQFIPNPTMGLIVSKYFQSQYAGQSSYTTDQIKIAYYYPC